MHARYVARAAFLSGLAIGVAGCSAQGMSTTSAHTYDQLQRALMDGKRVFAAFDFDRCHAEGSPTLNIQVGLPVHEFMIRNDRIAFSLTHSTVEAMNDVVFEFIRYTVELNGAVAVSAYTWKPGQSQAELTTSISCQLDNGVTFSW